MAEIVYKPVCSDKEYIERGKLIDDILHALLVVPSEDFLLPPERDIIRIIKSEPTADIAEVVRCKDCKFTKRDGCDPPAIYCKKWDRWEMPEDAYCYLGLYE